MLAQTLAADEQMIIFLNVCYTCVLFRQEVFSLSLDQRFPTDVFSLIFFCNAAQVFCLS